MRCPPQPRCSFLERSRTRLCESPLATACVVAALTWGLAAGGRAQQAFRSGVNLVLVDMRVISGDSQVPDLRADEVTLLIDGTARPIVSLAYYPVAQTRIGSQQQPAVVSRTDAGRIGVTDAGNRRIVLVVDRNSINPGEGRRVLEAAQDFITRLPDDYSLAVTTLPLVGGIRFEPDRRVSLRALADAFTATARRGIGLEGIAGFGCTGPAASAGCGDEGIPAGIDIKEAREMNTGAELQLQGRAVLGDLQWLFRAVADGPSDVVLITGGFPRDERMRPEINRVIGAARAGRVRVHTLELANLTDWSPAERGQSPGADGRPFSAPWPSTYGLPTETGGVEEVQAVSGRRFFQRLEHGLAGSYVLAFEPLPSERDGKPHQIEIRLSRRPQPTIHARKVFVLARSASPPGSTVAARSPSSGGLAAAVGSPSASLAGAESSAGVAVAAPGLRALIERASAYVGHFERTLSTVVAEERYVQVVKLWTGAPPAPGDEPELAWKPGTGEQLTKRAFGPLRRRQLLSDVLLVQAPGQIWIGYRDVAEVNGKAVRDRAVRVQKLFLSARAKDRRQLQRIAEESTRHNIGTGRNFNLPTFPLQTLQASNLGRFVWTDYPDDPQDSDCCALVGFREVASPTIVTTPRGRTIPMAGQLWIEPRTGRVRRAAIQISEEVERVQGAFDVTYRQIGSLDVLIPDRLWEWYRTADPESLGRQAYVEGQASYVNVRQFAVSTKETLK